MSTPAWTLSTSSTLAEAEEEIMCDTEASFIVQGLGRKYVKVPELELE